MVKIIEVDSISEPLVEAFKALMPQLSTSVSAPTKEGLKRIVNSDNTRLFVARDGSGDFIGTLTLVWYYTPSGCYAWIEDVVVDGAHRGEGVGELLVQKAVEVAKVIGAKKVSLTSNPTRVAAHGLYKKLKFEKRDSTLWAHYLETV